MKRTYLFFYYLWALLTPHQDVNIWSVGLAWKLAGIVVRPPQDETMASRLPPADDGYDDDDVDFEFEGSHWVDWELGAAGPGWWIEPRDRN